MVAKSLKSPGRAVGFLLAAALLGLFGLGLFLRQTHCGSAAVGERFVIPYQQSADLTAADREFELEGMRLRLSIASRPVAPLKDFTIQLALSDSVGAPVTDVAPELAWNMNMDMGRLVHQLRAVAAQPGLYQADVVLPVCMKGGTRWYGRLRVTRIGKTIEQVFLLDLK
jgi:hypothetical protein